MGVGGDVDEAFGDDLVGGLVELLPFLLAMGDELVDDLAAGEHGGEVVPELDFAVEIEGDGVEAADNVQIAAGKGGLPYGKVAALREVEHGHDGLGAPR